MRCDRCKYWGNEDPDDRNALYGTKRCSKATQMWRVGDWSDVEGEDAYTLKPEYADQKMFVKDGSDYMADLYTKPDFFCAHFTKMGQPA